MAKKSIDYIDEVVGWVFILVCLSGSMVAVIGLPKIAALQNANSSFEEKRVLCNRTVLAEKRLPERFDSWSVMFDNDIKTIEQAKSEIDTLKNRLLNTNKEINDMRALIACYFDK